MNASRRSAVASGGRRAMAPGIHFRPVIVSGVDREPTRAAWSERPGAHLARACHNAPSSPEVLTFLF